MVLEGSFIAKKIKFVASRYLFCVSNSAKTIYACYMLDAHYSVASCMFVAANIFEILIHSNQRRVRAVVGTSTLKSLVCCVPELMKS